MKYLCSIDETVTRRLPKTFFLLLIGFVDVGKAKLTLGEAHHLPSLCSSVTA